MMKKPKQKKTARQHSFIVLLMLAVVIFTGRLIRLTAIGIYEQCRKKPLAASGIFAFFVTFGFVAYNALFSQSAHHQTPLFETRALPQTQTNVNVTAARPTSDAIRAPIGERQTQVQQAELLLPPGESAPIPAEFPSQPSASLSRSDENSIAVLSIDSMTPQELLQLQKQMAAAGFYDGPLDGLNGPKTRIALAVWEKGRASNNVPSRVIAQNQTAQPPAMPVDRITTNAVTHGTVYPQGQVSSQSSDISQVDVFRVQAGLRLFGYNSVAISGVEDEATAQALRAFQKLFALQENGKITPEVIKKMREIGIFG